MKDGCTSTLFFRKRLAGIKIGMSMGSAEPGVKRFWKML